MEDPVKLPSGNHMDRPSITRHLLSDETDPFTRARCTVDMLIENPELKAEIAAWKAQRKAEAMAARAAAAAGGEGGGGSGSKFETPSLEHFPMDTS